jgi:hypothetical protein
VAVIPEEAGLRRSLQVCCFLASGYADSRTLCLSGTVPLLASSWSSLDCAFEACVGDADRIDDPGGGPCSLIVVEKENKSIRAQLELVASRGLEAVKCYLMTFRCVARGIETASREAEGQYRRPGGTSW